MFDQIKSALKSANARMKSRHDYAHLIEADENLLRDIGVSRGDVRAAMRRARRF